MSRGCNCIDTIPAIRVLGFLSFQKFGSRKGAIFSLSKSYAITSPFCIPRNNQSSMGSDTRAVTIPGGEKLTIFLLVRRSQITTSFFVSKLMRRSAANCKVLTDARRGSLRTTCTRCCPKTYIWPLPNCDSFVPIASRDCTGSYARDLSKEIKSAMFNALYGQVDSRLRRNPAPPNVPYLRVDSKTCLVIWSKDARQYGCREIILNTSLLSSQETCHDRCLCWTFIVVYFCKLFDSSVKPKLRKTLAWQLWRSGSRLGIIVVYGS